MSSAIRHGDAETRGHGDVVSSETLRDLQILVGSDRPTTVQIDDITIEFVPAP